MESYTVSVFTLRPVFVLVCFSLITTFTTLFPVCVQVILTKILLLGQIYAGSNDAEGGHH